MAKMIPEIPREYDPASLEGVMFSALEKLPEVQKRRIKKYYFDDKTEREIAKEENVSQKNVSKSLAVAKRNLKEILKNCN